MDDGRVSAWAILLILWIGGIAVYFWKTTEAQRQGHLVVVWGLMLLPVIYYGVMALLSL